MLVDSKKNNQSQPIPIQLLQSTLVFFTLVFPLSPVFLSLLTFLYPNLLIILIPYIFYLFHDKSYRTQLQANSSIRSLTLWKYYNQYFNSELVCEEDLDGGKNYVFGYHPHGILPFGITCSLANECDNLSQKLGKIHLKFVTLKTNFLLPFHSEHLKFMNFIDSDKSTLNHFLQQDPDVKGKGLVIAVGGAKESILAKPDTFRLVLKNRKGFVRIALRNKASLVPILGLGENEQYDQHIPEKGTWLHTFQTQFKNTFGYYLLLISGIGFIKDSFGFLPRHGPLTVIVGKPISVEEKEITEEVVNKYHKIYMDQVQALYERYKQYHQSRVFKLTGIHKDTPKLELV